jgi:hypothetical protein
VPAYAASLSAPRCQSSGLFVDAAAAQTAALLASRGVQLEVIIDEGSGLAMHGIAPFTKQPVALVGTAEKRLQSVQVGRGCGIWRQLWMHALAPHIAASSTLAEQRQPYHQILVTTLK